MTSLAVVEPISRPRWHKLCLLGLASIICKKILYEFVTSALYHNFFIGKRSYMGRYLSLNRIFLSCFYISCIFPVWAGLPEALRLYFLLQKRRCLIFYAKAVLDWYKNCAGMVSLFICLMLIPYSK